MHIDRFPAHEICTQQLSETTGSGGTNSHFTSPRVIYAQYNRSNTKGKVSSEQWPHSAAETNGREWRHFEFETTLIHVEISPANKSRAQQLNGMSGNGGV